MQSALTACSCSLKRRLPTVLRGTPGSRSSRAAVTLCRHYAVTATTIPEDSLTNSRPAAQLVDAAIKGLIGANEPETLRESLGRRRNFRYKLGASRTDNNQGTQWRIQLRQTLAAKLETEYQKDEGALACLSAETSASGERRHVLVRELMMTMRRFSTVDFYAPEPDSLQLLANGSELADEPGDAKAVFSAAWAQYSKIRSHVDAASLLQQVPLSAVSLLICELTFLPGSSEYRRRFERVVQIFNDYAEISRPIASPFLFSMYLRALNKLGRFYQVLHEVAAVGSSSPESVLSVAIMRQVIEAYFGGNRPDKALEIFYHVCASSEYRDSVTPHLYASAINGALRAKCLSTDKLYAIVEDLLSLLDKPSYSDASRTGLLNELLHAANKTGSHDILYHVFERFVDRGFPINYTTFGILLHCSCLAETDARVLYRVYRSITTHSSTHAKLTHHIFAIFINSFVRQNRVDHALSVVQDLRQHPSARLTAQHLSLIFAHYSEFGMAASALELFHTMVDVDKLTPSWTMCVDVVKAVGRGNSRPQTLADAELVASDPPTGELLHSWHTQRQDALLTRLVMCGLSGDATRMLDTFFAVHAAYPGAILPFVAVLLHSHHMAKQHAQIISRDPAEFSNPLSGKTSEAQHRNFVDRLHAFAESMLQASSTNLRIPQNMYNMAISLFAILRDHESTQRIYDHMTIVEDMAPTARTFNILLQSFVRGSDMATATDVLKTMRSSGVPLNRVATNALIHGFLSSSQPLQAIAAYAHMVGRPTPLQGSAAFQEFILSAPIDKYTYALLISGLVDAGLLKEAVIVFEDAFTVLPVVPRQLLETLVEKLEEKNQFEFAQLCLKRYTKRVEDSQTVDLQSSPDSGHQVDMLSSPAPDRLPLSYFGHLLDQKSKEDQ